MMSSTETMCEETPWSGEVVDFLANGRGYVFDFDRVPEIGTRLRCCGGETLELIAVLPYQRRDGCHSSILIWEDLESSTIWTSGLRAKGRIAFKRKALDMIIGEIK